MDVYDDESFDILIVTALNHKIFYHFQCTPEIPFQRFKIIQRRLKYSFTWVHADLEEIDFGELVSAIGSQNDLAPLDLFQCFFPSDVTDFILTFTNLYAIQTNFVDDATKDEIYCFLGELLLSGYACHVTALYISGKRKR